MVEDREEREGLEEKKPIDPEDVEPAIPGYHTSEDIDSSEDQRSSENGELLSDKREENPTLDEEPLKEEAGLEDEAEKSVEPFTLKDEGNQSQAGPDGPPEELEQEESRTGEAVEKPLHSEGATASLEERVRRLEQALAALQSASGVEESDSEETQEESRPGFAQRFFGIGKRNLPVVSTMKPTDVPKEGDSEGSPRIGYRWLFFEMYAELRSMLRMYLDVRYSLRWTTRLLVPLIIVGILLSRLFVGNILLIGWILSPILDLVLAYMLFKVLSREATRYRKESPDLPPSLRL